ncbi:hypothetical protein MMC22_003841 [Lobaria immixta]|nr:hypothetical protein [Lobaria immixta]
MPTGEASSSRASLSSIREEAPPVEDGARPTIDYINTVIDGLLEAPLVRRPIELDAGSGTRPLDTEREILASMLGRRSTGNNISTNDLPCGLKPRIGIEIPAELEGEPLRRMPELGSSTPRESAEAKLKASTSESPTSSLPAFPPLEANQAPDVVSAGPLVRHDEAFSPPESGVVSHMLGRPLPPIPEAAVREEPIRKPKIPFENSEMSFRNPPTSTDLDYERSLDPEADIHPAYRRRRENAPLRLFQGASAFLSAAPFNDTGRQSVTRRRSSRGVQLIPSALDKPEHENLAPPPRRHHYTRSTSDLASRNASDFPPRENSLMHRTDLLDQPRPDSNALGIYMADSLADPIESNNPQDETLPRNRHSVQILRSAGFDDLRAAQSSASVAQKEAPVTSHPSVIGRSTSTQARRQTHNEGVSQFNQEHYQGLGLSRTPPVRPPRPFSQSADQESAQLLPPHADNSTWYPYPSPWQAYPAPRHAYPRPPATQEEEVNAASAQSEADSMNHEAAIAQFFQPSAVERIAAVMGTTATAPAAATQLRSETLPSVVRERIIRDFVEDGERAMRRVSGGVKRVCLIFYSFHTLTFRSFAERKTRTV